MRPRPGTRGKMTTTGGVAQSVRRCCSRITIRSRLPKRPRSCVSSLSATAEGLTTWIVEQRNPAGLLARVWPSTFPYLEPALEGLTDPIAKSTSVTVA